MERNFFLDACIHIYTIYIRCSKFIESHYISGLDIFKAWFRLCPRVLYSSSNSLRINVTFLATFHFSRTEWRVPCHRQRQQFCLRGWKESLAVGRKVRRSWHESRIDDIPFPQRRGTRTLLLPKLLLDKAFERIWHGIVGTIKPRRRRRRDID